jgi:hypothetical protein
MCTLTQFETVLKHLESALSNDQHVLRSNLRSESLIPTRSIPTGPRPCHLRGLLSELHSSPHCLSLLSGLAPHLHLRGFGKRLSHPPLSILAAGRRVCVYLDLLTRGSTVAALERLVRSRLICPGPLRGQEWSSSCGLQVPYAISSSQNHSR